MTSQLKDTLSVTLQNGFVWMVRVLHGYGLREFSQHPLLEGLQTLIVVTAADELFVLQKRIPSQKMTCTKYT